MSTEDENSSVKSSLPKEVLSGTGLLYLYHSNDSGFFTSLEATKGIATAFFDCMHKAENDRGQEYKATLALQSSARRLLHRKKFAFWRARAITLERVYRGHLGRNTYEETQQDRDDRTRRAFWNSSATLVQKLWRGFYSRKHVHNFYLRKAYLDSVAQAGEHRRAELDDHFEKLYEMDMQRQQQERLEKFEKVVGSLHHMLSTGSCAGIYNSPYDQMAPATVYGLPIEEHLRNVAKGTLRTTILRMTGNTPGPETWVRGPTGKESEYGESYAHGPEGGAENTGGQLYAYSTKPIPIIRTRQ